MDITNCHKSHGRTKYKTVAFNVIEVPYPSKAWIPKYINGSETRSVRNKGAGIHV
uniref:Uncharacterized protein n=1 Tax=Arion vulgaris TaxID=1028688 RepID=A0A0B7AAA0_9EUPU